MTSLLLGLLVGLEIKHFIADYLLQPGWILAGKGDVLKPGGYAHAGIHAALSAVVLFLAGTSPGLVAMLFAAEFVIHYALDFGKIHYSRGVHVDRNPGRFWALHGLDQLAHQLTYAAMIYAVMASRGLA